MDQCRVIVQFKVKVPRVLIIEAKREKIRMAWNGSRLTVINNI